MKRGLVIIFLILTLASGPLGTAGCGMNWKRVTRTRFGPWSGRVPSAAELKPGDIILRMMDSPQSVVVAGFGLSHFSHGGIVFFREGEPWIVDCLGLNPRPAVKAEALEEFLVDKNLRMQVHVSRLGPLPVKYNFTVTYQEKVVHYLVLRWDKPLDEARFEQTLDDYLRTPTDFDHKFRLDNATDRRRLYCTEFIWRFLREATGEDLEIPFQSKALAVEGIRRLEEMIYAPAVMERLGQRYGPHYLRFMDKIGREYKRTILALPPQTRIISPAAFVLSSRLVKVGGYAAPEFRGQFPAFFDHYQAAFTFNPGPQEDTPASLEKLSRRLTALAHAAGEHNQLYYLRQILLRPESAWTREPGAARGEESSP